jgi:hypothetical protein
MQLQKLFQITPSAPQIFWEFFSPLSHFPLHNSILAFIFELENNYSTAHLSVALRLTLSLLVR